MVTWKGVGYTEEFTHQFDISLEKLRSGAVLEIVTGKDDLCATLNPGRHGYHCDSPEIAQRDAVSLESLRKGTGFNFHIGMQFPVSPLLVVYLQQRYALHKTRDGCASCKWQNFCTAIAQDKFRDTRLDEWLTPPLVLSRPLPSGARHTPS